MHKVAGLDNLVSYTIRYSCKNVEQQLVVVVARVPCRIPHSGINRKCERKNILVYIFIARRDQVPFPLVMDST